MSETGDLITRKYGNFRGVDFRGEDDNLARSPDSLNVWRDYKFPDGIRTRPGVKMLLNGLNNVHSVFFHKNYLYIHEGTLVWRYTKTNNGYEDGSSVENTKFGVTMYNNGKSTFFAFNDVVYFLDGKNYYRIDDLEAKDVTALGNSFIPTTSIGRTAGTAETPSSGTLHQDVNMLSDYRKNTFCVQGKELYLWLDTQDIESVHSIEVDGLPFESVSAALKSYNLGEGYVFWNSPAIPAPTTDGQDNVTITFKKSNPEKAKICGCTIAQAFDRRIFFSGNPDYPNMVWYSALNDPTYVSAYDCMQEGISDAAITGMAVGNNALWVFRENSSDNNTIFYHTPSTDAEFGKLYPTQTSNVSTGCIGAAVNFNDDIVFFSERGMEGISGDITTEQVIAHRSSLVDRKMITDASYKYLQPVEWEGYLIVFVGNHAYLADSRKVFTNEGHAEYEWYYWEFPFKVSFAAVKDGLLYLGGNGCIHVMTSEKGDNDEYTQLTDYTMSYIGKPNHPIESYWVTPKDRFAAPNKLKTTNKRGCVVEAKGDIEVYAKVEDTDFELIGSYEDVADYFVSRIKRKKFKDIQLKFHSNTRFSLESATLECFIGGYIKR